MSYAIYIEMLRNSHMEQVLDVVMDTWKIAVTAFDIVAVFVGAGTLMVPKLVTNVLCKNYVFLV